MTFWGELTDGTEMLLGEPMEAELQYDLDAPASQLRALFPADRMWEDLAYVRVFREGEVIFGGIVDEQNTLLDGRGLEVEVVCRSWEAILLDNEAQPGVIQNPSLGLLWERYLKKLGFAGIQGDESVKAGEWTVEKGTSCWELLETFCRESLGTTPYVDGLGTIHCEGAPPATRIIEEVLSAEIERKPCQQLSAVWQQSYRGTYDTPFRNPAASGVVRQRYVSMEDGTDPRSLIRQGETECRLLTVECGEDAWPGPGEVFTVKVQRLGQFAQCPVRSARYVRNSRGARTRLVLERGEMSCG